MGMLARLYAGTYPDEVAGFVSVDAAHDIYYEAYQELPHRSCTWPRRRDRRRRRRS